MEANMEKFPVPKVYGTVTIGERGQVVIPSKIRKAFRLVAGGKLIVIAKDNGSLIGLIPAEQFSVFLEQHEKLLAMMKKNAGE
jgi:AbrB family looped-hinge helix DNA binding protein